MSLILYLAIIAIGILATHYVMFKKEDISITVSYALQNFDLVARKFEQVDFSLVRKAFVLYLEGNCDSISRFEKSYRRDLNKRYGATALSKIDLRKIVGASLVLSVKELRSFWEARPGEWTPTGGLQFGNSPFSVLQAFIEESRLNVERLEKEMRFQCSEAKFDEKAKSSELEARREQELKLERARMEREERAEKERLAREKKQRELNAETNKCEWLSAAFAIIFAVGLLYVGLKAIYSF